MKPGLRLLTSTLLFVLAGCQNEQRVSPQAEGRLVAESRACLSCHTIDGSKGVGPTWSGLYLSRVRLSDGRVVTADDQYLRRSIVTPSADTVDGFPAGVMERVITPGSLSDREVQALVEYIKSLD